MSLDKNDLKMMYSLRWKHDPKREASSFVFVYDIPGITMHYQLFKNYLLKNSGNPGEDIRVSYIKDNGKECSIHSQADFQIALYTFRRSARAGDVIELLLERVSDRYHFKTVRQSNDVETQFDTPQNNTHSSCSNSAETPPEWLKTAIDELKIDLKNEILAEMKSIASLFLESHKLEAIELQDKEEGQKERSSETKSSETLGCNTKEEHHMDARPTNVQTSFPHMLGGEVYLHQWEVQNTGQVTWDSTTELQYSWGSKNLLPVEMKVPVPFLKPGEEGVVSVCLKIPTQRGQYLCYWQFMHKGRRFGQTLGVQVIVDGFEWNGSPKSDSEMIIDYETKDIPESAAETKVVENNATEPKKTSRSNSIKLRDEEQSLIPQQAVDLTTSPRDLRKYHDAPYFKVQSEMDAQNLGLLHDNNTMANPFTEQLEERENVLNSNNPQEQTAINLVGVQSSGRNGNENWITTNTLSLREQKLQALAAMGFWNFDLNSTLLDRYNDDINQTVAELLR